MAHSLLLANVLSYKGYSITRHKSGYTVYFNKDEIFFNSLTSAKIFIDKICKK